MSAIPSLGDAAQHLETRIIEAVTAGPVTGEIVSEIVQTVADAQLLDLASLLAWGRALHAAAAILISRGDEDGAILYSMAQKLIGEAFDRIALAAVPPDSVTRH